LQYQKPVVAQVQKQKLSPQLYQAVQMMALPIQDLNQRIQEEIERNPALEVMEDRGTESLETETPTSAADERREDVDFFENSSDPGYDRARAEELRDGKHRFMEGVLTRGETFHEHLLAQLHLQKLPDSWYRIGELLINNLDEDGFHIEAPESLVREKKDRKLLPEVMELVQGLDPVGCCTANYVESLVVQASFAHAAPEEIEEVIRSHLKLVNKGHLDQLATSLGTDRETVDEIIEILHNLNPFPGRQYSDEKASYVIPDLVLRERDGEFFLVFNDEQVPVLGINPFFEEIMAKKRGEEKEAKKYARERVKEAQWFINSIDMRNSNLLKVGRAILNFQREFFFKGPKYLVPLTLKDIAQDVDLHETTVSRLTNKKYLQTEWGIYELKYFFTNSISGAGSSGSRFSKEGVKQVIKEIIEESESKLSDQKISEILAARGIKIARRTVAKYRNELGVDSSFDR
jgi:RNA polymerase sigma-54 factor